MSLAALTACTNDEFESQNVAQEASPVQFEVLNNDAVTRASMNGNKIVWNANDGDIFTLYHGGAGITGYETAIYTAKANEGSTATLTTPSMILAGGAVMVWPVDTTFRALGEKPSLVENTGYGLCLAGLEEKDVYGYELMTDINDFNLSFRCDLLATINATFSTSVGADGRPVLPEDGFYHVPGYISTLESARAFRVWGI